MKKMLYVVLLVGLMMMLGACAEQSVEPAETSAEVEEKMKEEKEATEEAPAEEEAAAEEAPTLAQMGETLSVDGLNITVTDIKPYEGEINQFEPLQNDHAVQVDVIVENTTKDMIFVDAFEFKMYDAEGFEVPQALTNEFPISGEISGGKKLQGSIYFDVPAQEGTWEVHYVSMASFGGEPAIWEVPAK